MNREKKKEEGIKRRARRRRWHGRIIGGREGERRR